MNLLKQILILFIMIPSVVFAADMREITDQYAQKMLEASLQKQYENYIKNEGVEPDDLSADTVNKSNDASDLDLPSSTATDAHASSSLGLYHVNEGSLYLACKKLVEKVYGWHLVWLKQKIDYKIPYSYNIQEKGLTETLSSLLSGYPIRAIIYKKNHVVELTLEQSNG
ncbi:hypothetical protein [Cysteiniphilum halobium]|uniref:hypothetical protein n=1 Tax=Cysteiniphilum halobium TaxID=2219059 RepID=UPI000E6532EA|nr:hypothetical protein [Cysteiniphilum halobium]